ncbi:MAG: hypothetical protein RL701_8084 [Pseudomonadota bacterium]
MSIKPRNIATTLGVSLVWLLHAKAAAYSEPEYFAYPGAAAGGAGRYFTGSPADPYTCASCHTQGEAPIIKVLGLPTSGYSASTRYEITVDWSDYLPLADSERVAQVSAAMEITDMTGRRAGTLRLGAGNEVDDAELCELVPLPAARVITIPPDMQPEGARYCSAGAERLPVDCRQVVHVSECGAQRARFLWTAPSWDVGPLWFAGSVVAANGDEDTTGDGVTDIGRAVASQSADPELTARAGCSAAPMAPAAASGGLGSLLLAFCALTWRRIRHR